MFKFFSIVIITTGIFVFLSACAYKQPAGNWQIIDAPGVMFSGVGLTEEAKDKVYPGVCVEAQEEISAELIAALPARVKPLDFTVAPQVHQESYSKSSHQRATETENLNADFHVKIVHCELESEQTAATFTFYLTLTIQVSLKVADRTVMVYTMKTHEQAKSSTPDPAFEFIFAEPEIRSLMLLDSGRVWVPDGAR